MSCDLCPHCTAPSVLRLPRQRRPGDHGRYDAALLAAYDAARERTRQPVRLLVQVNPWLSRGTVSEQLTRARARGAVAGPDRDTVARLLAHPGYVYLTTHGSRPSPEDVVLWGLAPDEGSAGRLLAEARKGHAGT